MNIMNEEKKSFYNPDYHKKYNEKRKKIACNVSLEKYEEVKAHAELKGFQSLNSYILKLIDDDMKK